MTPDPLDTAAGLARRLPAAAIVALSHAAGQGTRGLRQLRARSGTPAVRNACDRLIAHLRDGTDPAYLAGAVAAAGHAEQHHRRATVEVVWTGPDSGRGTTRLTLAVVIDLIGSAARELLLVSYAAHSDPHLTAALEAAATRGVAITFLLERHTDNPTFASWSTAFASVDATRLAWPAVRRPPGAALHAKVLVVDDHAALIGSANLTSRAMEHNLECGVLLRGHSAVHAVRDHLRSLVDQGELVAVGDE